MQFSLNSHSLEEQIPHASNYLSDNEASLVTCNMEEAASQPKGAASLRKYSLPESMPSAGIPSPLVDVEAPAFSAERSPEAEAAPIRKEMTGAHVMEFASEALNMAAAGTALAAGCFSVSALKHPKDADNSALCAQASGAIWTAAAMLCQGASYQKAKISRSIHSRAGYSHDGKEEAVSRRLISAETSSNLLSAAAGISSLIGGLYAKRAIKHPEAAKSAGVWAAAAGAVWSLQGLSQLAVYGMTKIYGWRQTPWDMPTDKAPFTRSELRKQEIPEVLSNAFMLIAGGASLACGVLSYQAIEKPSYAGHAAALSLLSGTAWVTQSVAKKVQLILKSGAEQQAAGGICRAS